MDACRDVVLRHHHAAPRRRTRPCPRCLRFHHAAAPPACMAQHCTSPPHNQQHASSLSLVPSPPLTHAAAQPRCVQPAPHRDPSGVSWSAHMWAALHGVQKGGGTEQRRGGTRYYPCTGQLAGPLWRGLINMRPRLPSQRCLQLALLWLLAPQRQEATAEGQRQRRARRLVAGQVYFWQHLGQAVAVGWG